VAAATWILFALGCLGAADIALFHTVSHGIRRHPDSRRELLAHALRGPTYAALFLALPNCALEGGWYGALLALLAFDLAVSLWDFSMEGESRRALGGLPAGEYVVHVALAMLFGAMVAVILGEAGALWPLPSRIAWEPAAVPDLLRLALGVMAAGVLWSGMEDWRAARRMSDRIRSSPAPEDGT